MTNQHYFIDQVLPNIPEQQREIFLMQYPQVSFSSTETHKSVSTLAVLMLVALTGTGKSTTLEALKLTGLHCTDCLPSRRDIADFIVIPMMQHLRGEPFKHIQDRAKRFAYTRAFANQVEGGLGAVFSWLYLQTDKQLIISEGIRGTNEIQFAINHCPKWLIVELMLDPLTRLERLSTRNDSFDTINHDVALDFLPVELHNVVRTKLSEGYISLKSVAIMQAESENYGLYPSPIKHSNYHCLNINHLSPDDVARDIVSIAKERLHHA
ncbi:MAG: hypothetical protein Phog2KO_08950 [Phototrophicaceae bacterium]